MTQKFIKKNLELSLEFDRFVVKKPDILTKVQKGSCINITKKRDKKFNQESKGLAKKFTKSKERCFEARKEGSRWVVERFAY